MFRPFLAASALASALVLTSATLAQTGGSGGQAGGSEATLQLRLTQALLASMGLYEGPVDGRTGPRTREAIESFQQREQLPRTGELDQRTLQSLNGLATAALGGQQQAGGQGGQAGGMGAGVQGGGATGPVSGQAGGVGAGAQGSGGAGGQGGNLSVPPAAPGAR